MSSAARGSWRNSQKQILLPRALPHRHLRASNSEFGILKNAAVASNWHHAKARKISGARGKVNDSVLRLRRLAVYVAVASADFFGSRSVSVVIKPAHVRHADCAI
jgi:hypothetical protein